jgi:hypothetical protein
MGTVLIDERFNGPPASGNGGYSCAMAAQFLQGPVEVTLRLPPPLGVPLEARVDQDRVELLGPDGELVVEARPATLDIEPPPPIELDAAARASARYPWRHDHPYPTCFVCGPDRDDHDGLEIFPGPLDDRRYAAPWTPDQELATDGILRDEFVWSALDCPSGIVTDLFGDVGKMLLGRLTADLRRPVRAGAPHVVQAWTIGRDGRKLDTASAVHDADGELCAMARAVWIELAEPD